MEVRTRHRRKLAAVVLLLLIVISLVVVNVRERSRSEFEVPRFPPRKPQTVGFGWPLVAFRQPLAAGSFQIVDEDFPGGDEVSIPPRRFPARGWVSFDRPMSELHIGKLLANLAIVGAIILASAARALAWAKTGAHWTLREMFFWLTCATVIFAQTSLDHAHGGWWNPRDPYDLSWIDILNSGILAAGCACTLSRLINLLSSFAPVSFLRGSRATP